MPDDTAATQQAEQPEQEDSARAVPHVSNAGEGDTIHTGNIRGSGIAIGPGAVANVTITEERAYTVADLRTHNPYLGLWAFTEKHRDIFAGRKRRIRVLIDLLSADDGNRLLMIVDASGSGKSSLVHPGLFTALADRMRGQGQEVLTRVIDHPGPLPGTTLARLLAEAERSAEPSVFKFYLILVDLSEELFSRMRSNIQSACATPISVSSQHWSSSSPATKPICHCSRWRSKTSGAAASCGMALTTNWLMLSRDVPTPNDVPTLPTCNTPYLTNERCIAMWAYMFTHISFALRV